MHVPDQIERWSFWFQVPDFGLTVVWRETGLLGTRCLDSWEETCGEANCRATSLYKPIGLNQNIFCSHMWSGSLCLWMKTCNKNSLSCPYWKTSMSLILGGFLIRCRREALSSTLKFNRSHLSGNSWNFTEKWNLETEKPIARDTFTDFRWASSLKKLWSFLTYRYCK